MRQESQKTPTVVVESKTHVVNVLAIHRLHMLSMLHSNCHAKWRLCDCTRKHHATLFVRFAWSSYLDVRRAESASVSLRAAVAPATLLPCLAGMVPCMAPHLIRQPCESIGCDNGCHLYNSISVTSVPCLFLCSAATRRRLGTLCCTADHELIRQT